jgi:hypothetical protein
MVGCHQSKVQEVELHSCRAAGEQGRWRDVGAGRNQHGFSLRGFFARSSQNSVLIGVKAAALNPADHLLRAMPVKSYSHFRINLAPLLSCLASMKETIPAPQALLLEHP